MSIVQFKEENRKQLNSIYIMMRDKFGIDWRNYKVMHSIDTGIKLFLSGEGICKLDKGDNPYGHSTVVDP